MEIARTFYKANFVLNQLEKLLFLFQTFSSLKSRTGQENIKIFQKNIIIGPNLSMSTALNHIDETNTEIESIDLFGYETLSKEEQNLWINILKNFKNLKEISIPKIDKNILNILTKVEKLKISERKSFELNFLSELKFLKELTISILLLDNSLSPLIEFGNLCKLDISSSTYIDHSVYESLASNKSIFEFHSCGDCDFNFLKENKTIKILEWRSREN
jgi:hypothetical protein